MSLTEGMKRFHEQWTSAEPECQKCGRRAHWALSPVGHFVAMSRAPQMLCQICLTGEAPVQVPVYSDAPRENPNQRFDFDSWMDALIAQGVPLWRQWPGYDVFLGIAGEGRVWRAREFIPTQLLGSQEVLAHVIDGLCRMAVEKIVEDADAGLVADSG